MSVYQKIKVNNDIKVEEGAQSIDGQKKVEVVGTLVSSVGSSKHGVDYEQLVFEDQQIDVLGQKVPLSNFQVLVRKHTASQKKIQFVDADTFRERHGKTAGDASERQERRSMLKTKSNKDVKELLNS